MKRTIALAIALLPVLAACGTDDTSSLATGAQPAVPTYVLVDGLGGSACKCPDGPEGNECRLNAEMHQASQALQICTSDW